MGYLTEIGSKYVMLKAIASVLGFEFEVESTKDDYVFVFYPLGSVRALGAEYTVCRSEDLDEAIAKVFAEFILTRDNI